MIKQKLFKFNEEKLIYEQVSYFSTTKLILLSILLLVLMSFTTVKYIYVDSETKIDLRTDNTFSEENLRKEIKRLPFKYKDIIYAQCVLESGYFKSPVFKENNNLLGFKEARQRITTAKGTHLNHAYYDSWKDCLLDALIYQVKYTSKLPRDKYLDYLNRVYAEDPNYKQKLIKLAKQW